MRENNKIFITTNVFNFKISKITNNNVNIFVNKFDVNYSDTN